MTAANQIVSLSLLACVFLGQSAACVAADGFRCVVTYDAALRATPYTGRVYLFFGGQARTEPRQGPNWFRPAPFASLDVKDWKPGESLEITPDTPGLRAFPSLDALKVLKNQRVQAVARFNPFDREVGTGPGNGYSDIKPVGDKPVELSISQLVKPAEFQETETVKLLRVRSEKLSKFYGQEVFVQGAVLLPTTYAGQTQRRYPVLLQIPGFGGTHQSWSGRNAPPVKDPKSFHGIEVLLDPSCPLGHHVFADSANNGPWGAALTEEFLPVLDKTYRTVAEPTARFLTGHSSGGWSSLWLQVAYPDTFGGTWSTAPDPVDFHDFQRIDMYQAASNMYRDEAGTRRPIARLGKEVALWYDDFDRMEVVLGHGGQLLSFEAVFSPRGADGAPLSAWSRETGAVIPAVTTAWKEYDIREILETRWETLGPKLQGKLHVIMGEEDTFYLEGATRRLKATLEELKSDAVVEMVPGRNHFNLLSTDIATRIRHEMQAAFLKAHPRSEVE